MDPDWRCISIWKWWYSIAMLVYQRVSSKKRSMFFLRATTRRHDMWPMWHEMVFGWLDLAKIGSDWSHLLRWSARERCFHAKMLIDWWYEKLLHPGMEMFEFVCCCRLFSFGVKCRTLYIHNLPWWCGIPQFFWFPIWVKLTEPCEFPHTNAGAVVARSFFARW